MLPQTQPQGSAMGWGTEKPPPPPTSRQQRRISQATAVTGSGSSPQKLDASPNIPTHGWQPPQPTFGNMPLSASSSFNSGLSQQQQQPGGTSQQQQPNGLHQQPGYQTSPQTSFYSQQQYPSNNATSVENGAHLAENGSSQQQQQAWSSYYQQPTEGYYSDQQGYAIDASNQGYSVDTSQQGYSVDANQQGYSVDPNHQGYSVDANNQGYSVDANNQGYSVDANNQGYSVDANNQGYSVDSSNQQAYQQYYQQEYQGYSQDQVIASQPPEMSEQQTQLYQQSYQQYGEYGNYTNQTATEYETYPNEEGGQAEYGSHPSQSQAYPENGIDYSSQQYANQDYQQNQAGWNNSGAAGYHYDAAGEQQQSQNANYTQSALDPSLGQQAQPNGYSHVPQAQPPPFEPVELTGLSFGTEGQSYQEPIVRRSSENKAARSSSPPRRVSEATGPQPEAPTLFAPHLPPTVAGPALPATRSLSPPNQAEPSLPIQPVKPPCKPTLSQPPPRSTRTIPEEAEESESGPSELRVYTRSNDDADAESGAIHHSQDFSSLPPPVSPARSRRRSSAKSPSRGRSPPSAIGDLPARNDITPLQNGPIEHRSRSTSRNRSLSPTKQAQQGRNFAYKPGEIGSPRLPDTLSNIYIPPSPKSKSLVISKNTANSSVTSIMSHQRMSVMYDWIIPNYDVNYIQNAQNAEDKLSSYPFGSENLRYQAILYPKGVMEGKGTHLSAFLRPIKNADEVAAGDKWTRPILCFTFRVKKMFSNGAEEELLLEEMSEPSFEAFSEGVPGWGFAKFMPLDYVKEALYEGKLHVEVEVIWDCDVPVDRIEHLQVGDFANRLVQNYKGEMVSNVFGKKDMQFQLIVYPCGDAENPSCVSAYVRPIPSRTELAVGQEWARSISNLTIQIVQGRDGHDTVVASKSLTGGFTFDAQSPQFGWGKFCEHKILSGVDSWSVFCSINYDEPSNYCHVTPALKSCLSHLQETCEKNMVEKTSLEKKADALQSALNKVQRELEQSAFQLKSLQEKQRSKLDSYVSEVEGIREQAMAQHEEWSSQFHVLSRELQQSTLEKQQQIQTHSALSIQVANAKSRLARVLMSMENDDSIELIADVARDGHKEPMKMSDYKKLQDRVHQLNVELVRLKSNVNTLNVEKEAMEQQVKHLKLQNTIVEKLQAQVTLSPLRSPGVVSEQGDEPMDVPGAIEALRQDMQATRQHLEEVKAKVTSGGDMLPTTERSSMNAELSMKQTELELSRAALEDAEDNARIQSIPIQEEELDALKKEHDYLRLEILDFMAYLGSSVDVNAGAARYTGAYDATTGQYANTQVPQENQGYDYNAYQNYQGYPYYQNYQSGVYDPSYVNTTADYPAVTTDLQSSYPVVQGDADAQIQAYKSEIDRLNMELNELRGKAFAATEILSGPSRSSQGSPIHPSLQGRMSVASYGYPNHQYPPMEVKAEPEVAPLTSLLSVDAPAVVEQGTPEIAPPLSSQKPPLAKPMVEPKKPIVPDPPAEPEYKYEDWEPAVKPVSREKVVDPEELLRTLKRTKWMNSIKNTLFSMIFFTAALFFATQYLCSAPTTELTDVGLSLRHAQAVSHLCEHHAVLDKLENVKSLFKGHVFTASRETLSSVSRGVSWIQDKGVPNSQRNFRIMKKKWNKSVKGLLNSFAKESASSVPSGESVTMDPSAVSFEPSQEPILSEPETTKVVEASHEAPVSIDKESVTTESFPVESVAAPQEPSVESVEPVVLKPSESVEPSVESEEPSVLESSAAVEPTIVQSGEGAEPSVEAIEPSVVVSSAAVEPTIVTSGEGAEPTVAEPSVVVSSAAVEPTAVQSSETVEPTVAEPSVVVSSAAVEPTVVQSSETVEPGVEESSVSVEPSVVESSIKSSVSNVESNAEPSIASAEPTASSVASSVEPSTIVESNTEMESSAETVPSSSTSQSAVESLADSSPKESATPLVDEPSTETVPSNPTPVIENVAVVEPGWDVTVDSSTESATATHTTESEKVETNKKEAAASPSVIVQSETNSVAQEPSVDPQSILETLASDLQPRLQVQETQVVQDDVSDSPTASLSEAIESSTSTLLEATESPTTTLSEVIESSSTPSESSSSTLSEPSSSIPSESIANQQETPISESTPVNENNQQEEIPIKKDEL